MTLYNQGSPKSPAVESVHFFDRIDLFLIESSRGPRQFRVSPIVRFLQLLCVQNLEVVFERCPSWSLDLKQCCHKISCLFYIILACLV